MKPESAYIPELVWQFADDCDALWLLRENAAAGRTFEATLADLDRLDGRIDASIDGLRTAGGAGWSTVAGGLDGTAQSGIFTAAVLAFEKDADEWLETLFDGIKESELAMRALDLALEWIDPSLFARSLERMPDRPRHLSAAVRVRANAKRNLVSRLDAAAALDGGSSLEVRAVCEAAVFTGSPWLLDATEAHFTREDAITPCDKALIVLLRGSHRAIEAVKRMVTKAPLAHAERAASALFRYLAPEQAISDFEELFDATLPSRPSIRAAGAAGIRELIPFLLESMDCEAIARAAGKAFCEMTGVDLEGAGLSRPEPATSTSGLSDDPDDEKTELDADEGRPWPDRSAVQAWWSANGGRYEPLTRYLYGAAVNRSSLVTMLHDGPQSVRAASAELLAIRGESLFDVVAPAFRQREQLAKGSLWQ